jgi:hypothetical protein
MFKNKIKIIYLITLLVPILLIASDEGDDLIKKTEPLTREKSLMVYIDYGNGHIELGKTSAKNVFEGEFFYKTLKPDIQYEVVGTEGRLNVDFSGKIIREGDDRDRKRLGSLDNLYDNDLVLNLTPELPMDLDLELGVVKGNMDLGGLSIKSFDLEVGVSEADIVFDQPNQIQMNSFHMEGGVGKLYINKIGNANVNEFSFEGGVGSYELNFTGNYKRNLHASIEMGMGKLTLYLPHKVGTKIEVDKSFLSSFSIDDVYKKDDIYYNDNWNKTPYNLDLYIETGVGKIEVVWVDN